MSWRITDTPPGLSLHARSFLRVNAVRVPVRAATEIRESLARQGIPEVVIERMVQFQQVWAGIAPGPARCYGGGPQAFDAGAPARDPAVPCWFEPGLARDAVPYSFGVGPTGEFLIVMGDNAIPLYGSIEGWIEAVALERVADTYATAIRRLDGAREIRRVIGSASWVAVDKVDGRADSWLCHGNMLLALRTGEAQLFEDDRLERAYLYRGIPDTVWAREPSARRE